MIEDWNQSTELVAENVFERAFHFAQTSYAHLFAVIVDAANKRDISNEHGVTRRPNAHDLFRTNVVSIDCTRACNIWNRSGRVNQIITTLL